MKGIWTIWVMYVIGQSVNFLMKADQQAMSKFTPWDSVREYLRIHRAEAAFRLFVSTCIFLLWWDHPSTLNFVGSDLANMLPLNAATAGVYGTFSDRILDYLMQKIGCKFNPA